MAKQKSIENLSTEKLRKLLLTYNIIAVIGGIAAIGAIVLYISDRLFDLLNREDNLDLLILGAVAGAGISFVGTLANKIKKEIQNRADK